MRAAPAVAVRCSGGALWRALRTGLPALAAGSCSAWLLLHLEVPAWPALGVAVAVGGFAWRRTRPQDLLLQWDGQRWLVDGEAGRLQLMMDLGPCLLLRLHRAQGTALWVPVTAREAGAAWHGLRAAVYSRPPENTPGVRRPERVAD